MIAQLTNKAFMQKCLAAYLFLSRRIWTRLKFSSRFGWPGRVYGRHLHALVCRHAERKQNHSTFFFRNRSELELMCLLSNEFPSGSSLNLCVLACSKGAEVYSILSKIRAARPDLKINTYAVDLSREIVEFALQGVYSLTRPVSMDSAPPGAANQVGKVTWNTYRDQGPRHDVSIFERMTEKEMQDLFEMDGDAVRVRPWVKQGISWRTGDASDPELLSVLGPQDIVVANRFLCHMAAPAAENCLRNIATLVKPGGHLFVSGVDLDVRAKVAHEMGWHPVPQLMKEVHEGDVSLMNGWPFDWWGLEPFCHDFRDWRVRYASVFRIGKMPRVVGLDVSRRHHTKLPKPNNGD